MSDRSNLRLSTGQAPPGRAAQAPNRRRSLIPVLLPVVGISLVMLVLMNGWLRPSQAATQSEVVREIRKLVLTKSEQKGLDDGGAIGSWWVSAEDTDAATGTLKSFRVTAGPTIIAAREADLHVDSDLNAYTFLLRDVVIVRLGIEGPTVNEPSVLKLDTYRLGPIPYHREIEPDGADDPPARGPKPAAEKAPPLTRAQ